MSKEKFALILVWQLIQTHILLGSHVNNKNIMVKSDVFLPDGIVNK